MEQIEVTPDQKLQIFCAALQGVIAALKDQIESSPSHIVEKARAITAVAVGQLKTKGI